MKVKHDNYKDFVNAVSEKVLQENDSIIKIGSSKTNLFSVSFIQPKTRRGIVNFYLRKKGAQDDCFGQKLCEIS